MFRINIPKKRILHKLLILVKGIVEYAFGMQIGYVLGWIIGLYVGHYYIEYFEPVYMYDLSQLSFWRLLPSIFAQNGALIGVAVGMIAIAIINNILLDDNFVS